MSTITTRDGTQIYYKDWGRGQPVVFSHGWPLSADAWDDQMLFLGEHGYRVIAHDRRGHGRSSQPWTGNDLDTYADDLAALIEALDLRETIHVGHSTGGGEVARYIGRHGTRRVAKAVLISAIPPLMLKTPSNPGGLPIEAFDAIRAAVLADRAQFFKDLTGPFYGANRPGSKVSQGLRDSFWRQGMQAGIKAVYDCVKAFSETDQTDDLRMLTVPTLLIHGDDDQIVPIGASAHAAVKIAPKAQLKVYPGAPHGLPSTHKQQLNADLLEAADERRQLRVPEQLTDRLRLAEVEPVMIGRAVQSRAGRLARGVALPAARELFAGDRVEVPVGDGGDAAPPAPRIVERRHRQRLAERELLHLGNGHRVLREFDEVTLLLPREMGDHPRDRVDRPEAPRCVLGRYRLESADPFAAREAQLRDQRVRRHRSSVFFIVPMPCSIRPAM